MFSKILLPLDGSPLSESIICQVEDMAACQKGQIMLLRVAEFHPFPGAEVKDIEAKLIERSEKYLAGIAEDMIKKGLEVTTHVRYGDPAREILAHAEKHASVIVMTTHGRGGLSRWAFGSVTDKVVRRSSKPVLLIRPEKDCQV